MKVIQTEEDVAEIWRNYEYVGMDLAAGPDHSVVGHLIFERIPPVSPHLLRELTNCALACMGFEELIPRYPDIEQMLLDCTPGNC